MATLLKKFEEAEKRLNQAEKAIDRIGDYCAELLSPEQRDSAKTQIEQLRRRLPMRKVQTLRVKWTDHQQQHQLTRNFEKADVPNMEAASILRDLGVASIHMGDLADGQKNLEWAFSRMVLVRVILGVRLTRIRTRGRLSVFNFDLRAIIFAGPFQRGFEGDGADHWGRQTALPRYPV